MKRCGPSCRPARNASAVFNIFVLHPKKTFATISAMSGHSITAHSANKQCRRQIEKSPLAQIEMSLSTVLVGEFWADDGDCHEPDGDRPDERVAGSGCKQDQSNGSRDADEPWSASGVPTGQGAAATWPEESYVQGRIGHPGVALRDLE